MTEVSYKRKASKQGQITIRCSLLILVAAGYSNLPVYLIILCSVSSLLCGCSPCRRLMRFRNASPPSTCGLCFCDPLWGLAASFISLFPVISVRRTIYLLQTYSFLQGMNKLRRSLDSKPCCKICMPDKYIGFHPIVVWLWSQRNEHFRCGFVRCCMGRRIHDNIIFFTLTRNMCWTLRVFFVPSLFTLIRIRN